MPYFSITDIPDMGMIDGLMKFQQNKGPTEAALGETLANQGIINDDLLAAAKPKSKPYMV
ncbi:hypothetical protein [Terasakiella sp.]|uniref:hypothetical protein n=1 Tax=Terasakiella sp. TaxID=2034861 RepID=UPI003AA9C147